MVVALKNNRIVASPEYKKIIYLYNEELKDKGKVNDKKFWETHITKLVPGYSMQSWYKFLKRFKTDIGLIENPVTRTGEDFAITGTNLAVTQKLAKTMLSNQLATAKFIQHALNVGAERAEEIANNPSLLSAKDALDLALKAMRAQDSRIHAVGKIREDNREQERFEQAFSGAAYGDDTTN